MVCVVTLNQMLVAIVLTLLNTIQLLPLLSNNIIHSFLGVFLLLLLILILVDLLVLMLWMILLLLVVLLLLLLLLLLVFSLTWSVLDVVFDLLESVLKCLVGLLLPLIRLGERVSILVLLVKAFFIIVFHAAILHLGALTHLFTVVVFAITVIFFTIVIQLRRALSVASVDPWVVESSSALLKSGGLLVVVKERWL